MPTHLPRSTPVEQHVDPAAVLAFVDAVEADPAIELHGLMVLRHGHVVAEGWWAPHVGDQARLLYSLSKSFTSTALAFALDEGLLDLDQTVVSHFPEFADDITEPRSRRITVRHLASMASGHTRDMAQEALARDPQEPVRGFLLAPPDEEPGSVFAYSQPCTYTLASILQRVTGARLTDYLRPRLLDPLGIGEVAWQTWPPGREQGFSGLFARTEDVAKLGQLYLQGGRWGGTQLIPQGYVDAATSCQVATPDQGSPDWCRGYGFQFWMSRHGYRGDGAFGQFCLVLPEHDAVVAITGGTEAMQEVLDAVWEHLIPAFRAARPDDARQQDLEDRLRGLALPMRVAQPSASGWDGWAGEPFRVLPRAASKVPFTAVTVHRAGQGLELTLAEPGNALTFPVGTDGWARSSPRDRHGDPVAVAASGGWRDDRTLVVDVVFLETPHRLTVTCALPGRAAEVLWRHVPLVDGSLQTLRRPR